MFYQKNAGRKTNPKLGVKVEPWPSQVQRLLIYLKFYFYKFLSCSNQSNYKQGIHQFHVTK